MANVYVYSGAVGTGDGSSWANAYTTLAAALTAKAAGDDFWVAHDHAHSQASAMTLTPPGTVSAWNRIICVDRAGSVPPVAADLRTTATVSTTGANGIILAGGYAYWYGITMTAGDAANAAALQVLSTTGQYIFTNCVLAQGGSASAAMIWGSTGAGPQRIDLINTKLSFAGTGHTVQIRNLRATWRDTATAIQGTVPTVLFQTSSRGGTVVVEGVDLSAAGSGKTLVGVFNDPITFYFRDCKLNASVTKVVTPTSAGGADIIFTRCDASATNYVSERHSYMGSQSTSTTVVLAGGASTGSTSFSERIATTTGPTFHQPFESLPFAVYNTTVGSAVSVTVEGVLDSASLPTNGEIWIDVECLGTSGNPLGVTTSGAKASVLATAANLTASTAAWDSGASARANSTAYVVGDVIKLASNAGRVFFCTTAGTSAGSEPAGYASAVDGGGVTDGTAVFRAGRRFKQTVSVTPQIAGVINIYPKVAIASATVYLDPKPTLA